MRSLIAIALLLATALPAAAQSQYDYTQPPEKISCIGKLQLDDNSKSISLDTQMMHGKKFNDDAIPCASPLDGRDPWTEKVRDVCNIGDICEIEGMIKPFGHDIYEWTRINRVRKRA